MVFVAEISAELRTVYDATAPRAEYAELIANGEAVPSRFDAADFRRARSRIGELAPVRVRLGYEPGLRGGAELLAATWRDYGLAIAVAHAPPFDARLVRRAELPRGAVGVARSRGQSRRP